MRGGEGERGRVFIPERMEVIAIDQLKSKQRAHLRGLAHTLKPIAHIGKEGLTPTVARAVEEALNTRELLKVKVLEAAPADAREIGAALAERLGGHVVQVMGRIITLYRRHPDHPKIELPR